MSTAKPLIAVTMGDPAGVGPEIVVKALAEGSASERIRPLVIGDAGVLEKAVAGCGARLAVRPVGGPGEVEGRPATLEVMDLANVADHRFGVVDGAFGRAAVQYIEQACALARAGAVEGLVTAPINKEAIRAGGSQFPGHTEMLASLLGVAQDQVFTLFVLDRLRIFFLTRHHPLRDAIARIGTDGVAQALERMDQLTRLIGVDRPRLALAGLNPHAGENGLLGSEENEILRPAVERARARGVDVVGPVPADAVFFQCREGRYDAVLSLYHDQGHIAAKTVDFYRTVSCTLGLPVIRTSVDHGTAFDIAGRWVADVRGQVAALHVAGQLAPYVLAARTAARPLS
jgi:4-hydroxythreonine-4-phosphate dehydrogenase